MIVCIHKTHTEGDEDKIQKVLHLYETLMYCSHVWMAPGKISCELTGSPSLNKVFELN